MVMIFSFLMFYIFQWNAELCRFFYKKAIHNLLLLTLLTAVINTTTSGIQGLYVHTKIVIVLGENMQSLLKKVSSS